MSGLVAIVNRDGAPVAGEVLQRMVAVQAARGPDAQRVWLGDGIALAHTWLRTTDDPLDPPPLTLDGQVWIVADVRLDHRDALVDALGVAAPPTAMGSDAALVLLGYRRWGEALLDRLRGDFAFVLWDARRRRLLCARDPFGVKPLYYAPTPQGVVVSNTLECVRLHPGLATAVDEQAIADFLLFGASLDPAATAFRAIRRLPAAHRLLGPEPVSVRRYWSLPIDPEITYRHPADYIEHFGALLTEAVGDRLRCRRAAVLMSGGLDSTSVAAIAAGAPAPQKPVEVRAHTVVSERLLPDPERRYAALAAAALGIPIEYRRLEDYAVYERWDRPEMRRPEPEADPLTAVQIDLLRDASAHSRVVLTGYGGDPAFRVPITYATSLLRRGRWGRLARETAQYARLCGRLPRISVARRVRHWLDRRNSGREAAPAWLDPGLVARLDLPARVAAAAAAPVPEHPTRPLAYAMLTSPEWPTLLERYDAGVTGVPVDVRHPFFDVRLIRFLLSIPPLPWCYDKTIVRLAMRGRLPDAIRTRPKAVAAGDAVVALLGRPAARWVDGFSPRPELGLYVRRERVPLVHGRHDPAEVWTNLRPLCLNYWLGWQPTPADRRVTA